MQEQLVREKLKVRGMTCSGCERRIEKKLQKLKGIIDVKANYSTSSVDVAYNKSIVTDKEISGAIEQLGYKVTGALTSSKGALKSQEETLSISHLLGIGIVIFAVYCLLGKYVLATRSRSMMRKQRPLPEKGIGHVHSLII